MIDTSDAAIEADLSRAESGGTPGVIAMLIGRAQIRATLRASRPPAPAPAFQALPVEGGSLDIQIAQGPFGDSYAVPAGAIWEDRVEAAARMLQISADRLDRGLREVGLGLADVSLEAPAEPDIELDVETDDDGTLDDLDEATVDEDFFADVKKARKR